MSPTFGYDPKTPNLDDDLNLILNKMKYYFLLALSISFYFILPSCGSEANIEPIDVCLCAEKAKKANNDDLWKTCGEMYVKYYRQNKNDTEKLIQLDKLCRDNN